MPCSASDRPALVVDLDETLIKTDTLHETLLRIAVRNPLEIVRLVPRLREGKAGFKRHVADLHALVPDELPVNPSVLDMIHEARANGREVALVSASDHRQVEAVARHLGLFDVSFGTGAEEANGQNLGRDAKAAFLSDRYGPGGFDYVGDCDADLPIWKIARNAYTVSSGNALSQRARQAGIALQPVPGAAASGQPWRPYLKALRPHQWSKNILIFLPMIAAQDLGSFEAALLAFVFFSLLASSVYILNDLVDLPSDRAHPRKCKRPFAAGDVPIAHGVAMAAVLILGCGVLSALLMPVLFQLVLAAYFLVTLAYSFVLKKKLIVDVVTLAGLYTLRIIAGAAATAIMPSPWLLAFSVFLFYSLASIKRQGELVDKAASGAAEVPGRGYLSSDVSVLQIIAISSGQAAVLVFALYLYTPTVTALYATPEILWLICPVLLYWLSRIAILTHRGYMNDDPIVFAAKDRISLATGLVVVLIMLAAEIGW